jgi:hypothetical protein
VSIRVNTNDFQRARLREEKLVAACMALRKRLDGLESTAQLMIYLIGSDVQTVLEVGRCCLLFCRL